MSERTKAQVDEEYTHLAIQLGHKIRVQADLNDEIRKDTWQLQELNKEALQIKQQQEEQEKSQAPEPEPAA